MSYNESLNSNSNYPPMSQLDWDNAPWNQEEEEESSIDITVSQTLSKDTDIGGYKDEGYKERIQEYKSQHKTPLELINILKDLLTEVGERIPIKNLQYWKNIIEECKDWVEDDFDVNE